MLPDSTGYTLFNNTEKERRKERSDIASATLTSLVNKYASFFPNVKQRMKKNKPMVMEVPNKTFIVNFTALAFPLPNSFATRTLYKCLNFNMTRISHIPKFN